MRAWPCCACSVTACWPCSASVLRPGKTAPRDRFVGWDPATRQRNLPLVVNHARYLILPWIRLPSLASHLLACLQRQLPRDWHQRYGIRPVLLETFCETPRFQGTCYRAANWIHLGQTQGRGKPSIASSVAAIHGPLERLPPDMLAVEAEFMLNCLLSVN